MKVPLFVVAIIAAAISPAKAESAKIYFGYYTWGAEVEIFSPCGTNKAWWVLASDAIWQQLSKAHQKLTTTPYEGIYVKVSGSYAGPATDEDGAFATQYEGLFKITKVWFARAASKTDCTGAAKPN